MLNIKVFFIDGNKLLIDNLFSSLFLTKEDIVSLTNIKNERVKKENTISLILKRKKVPDFYIDDNGKPLSNNKFFNISHSHGAVIYTESDYPIGVDIELIKPYNHSMINYISSCEEKEYIKSDINFYEIWTNKESLVKCIGTGIKDNIPNITGLPVNGEKTYNNKTFYCRTIKYKDYLICVTRESEEPFNIDLIETKQDLLLGNN